jgi:myosin heavy subunit
MVKPMNEPTLFDMSEIQPTGQVVQATERIKLRLKRTAEDIIAIGQDLILIKAELGHGQFLPWIEMHFDMGQTQAHRFIQVAERFGQIHQIGEFKPSVLYELAAPSTSDEVVEIITAKVESGEKVSVKEVQALKRQIKEEQELKDKIHHELSVNKQMVNYLKKDIEEFNQERDQLSKEIERLQAAVAQPVVKEIEVIKEVEVVKEVTVIPDGYSSVEKAIAEKQARLKELEKEESIRLEERRKQIIDMRDLETRIKDGLDVQKSTTRAMSQVIGRLRFAMGEAKTYSVKINPDFVSDIHLEELSKVITGINEIYREITIGKNVSVDPNLAHNSMKAVQIVSI